MRPLLLWLGIVALVTGCGSVSSRPEDVPAVDATADASPDAPGDAQAGCTLAAEHALSLPADTVTAMLSGTGRGASATCAATVGGNGPEQLYRLRVPARTGLVLRVHASFDTAIAIRTACDRPLTEVACNDDGPGGTHDPLVRAVLDPGDYYVLVDRVGAGAGGTYSLTLSTYLPSRNGSCETAAAVTEGAHLTGQDARAGAASSIACAPGDNGAALHYIATVPPRNRLRVTATPTGEPAWSPVVRLATGCDAATCFAVESPLFSSDAASAAWVDPAMSPAEVHVAVGGAGAGASGTFDLDVALDAPPSDDACAAATPVVDGTTLVDQDLSLASGPLPCSAGTGGHARYFRTTIPAGAALTATVAMAWNVPVAIRVLSSCAATTCLASSTFGPPYGAVLRHVNPGDAAQDVVIAVGCGPAQDPHFGLSVAIRAAGEQAAHGRPRQPVRERRGPFTPSAKPQGDPPGIRDRAAHRHALGCNGVTSPRTRAHAPRLASHFDRLWTVP